MTAYAISAWIVRDASREQALAVLADSGFRAVELSGSGSALLTALLAAPARCGGGRLGPPCAGTRAP